MPTSPSPESSHICLRRPCVLCAIEQGKELPAGTRLVEPTTLRPRLVWDATEARAAEVSRLARKLEGLSSEQLAGVEALIDALE